MRKKLYQIWDKERKIMSETMDIFEVSIRLHRTTEKDRFIVRDWTGRKDKHGTEICEGDILKDEDSYLYEVKFGKLPLHKSGDCVCSYLSFYLKCYGKLGVSPIFACEDINSEYEVIGNIFENLELLESEENV